MERVYAESLPTLVYEHGLKESQLTAPVPAINRSRLTISKDREFWYCDHLFTRCVMGGRNLTAVKIQFIVLESTPGTQ